MTRCAPQRGCQRRLRAGAERLQAQLDYFPQTTHAGTIQLDGDTASGRAYISKLLRFRDGRSEPNYAVYHDRYQHTSDGWQFVERGLGIPCNPVGSGGALMRCGDQPGIVGFDMRVSFRQFSISPRR